MLGKLESYDILGVVVPGTLAVYGIALLFPHQLRQITVGHFPESFVFLVDLASVILVGQLLQALGSALEPVLFVTFGGIPSERVFKYGLGDHFMSRVTAEAIRGRLAIASPDTGMNDQEAFRFALSHSHGCGRVDRFNALYAYHRSLLTLSLTLLVLFVASCFVGGASYWTPGLKASSLAAIVAVSGLGWYRAKQRAYYLVREVLETADRVLDERTARPGGTRA